MSSGTSIAREGVGIPRSFALGPIASVFWTLSLSALLFFALRESIEGSSETGPREGPARLTRLAWPSHSIFGLAWSPDGQRLAASGRSPQVRVWELETGSVRSIEPEDGLDRFVMGWTADGRGIVVCDLDGRPDILDAAEPRPTAEASREADASALGRATLGASIRLWGREDGRSKFLPEDARSANAAAFAPDGRMIATAGRDGGVHLWEAAFGRRLRSMSAGGPGVNVVAFSPDGARLASGGSGPVRVWDVASGRELMALGNPRGGCSSLAFSADGRRVAGATWSGTIRVWDLETGREREHLAGYGSHVAALAWSPDGRRLASGGHDAMVRIWEIPADR